MELGNIFQTCNVCLKNNVKSGKRVILIGIKKGIIQNTVTITLCNFCLDELIDEQYIKFVSDYEYINGKLEDDDETLYEYYNILKPFKYIEFNARIII